MTDAPFAMVLLAFIFLTGVLAAISVIDWQTHRIPDLLSLPLIAAGLAWNVYAGGRPFADVALGAAAGYACLAGFGWLYFRHRGYEGLGLGDAKLFAAAGAWLGWQGLPTVLLMASSAGLIFALSTRHGSGGLGDFRIAFGPWIALALWVNWIGGWPIG